jgi:hypothetical protein
MFVQVIRGKILMAEVSIDRSAVREVEMAPDPDSADQGHFTFELLGGPKEDPRVLYAFTMAHGIDQPRGHQDFKH